MPQATPTSSASPARAERLPLGALLVLAMAAFITLLTEIMPAGLLSAIAAGLQVSDSMAGQFITAYAAGALLAAIPATALTQGVRRRPLLLSAIFGFAVVNGVTALSGDYAVILVARFLAGVFGGIVWSLLAGYAVRISPPRLSGRAIAISGAGATIALVIGVPLGAMLGRYIGWQGAFGLISILALLVILWGRASLPDVAGQRREHRQPLGRVLRGKGIRAVLFVVITFVVAHNILYIYVEPLLQSSGLAAKVDIVLFTFGAGSIAGLLQAGALVDRRLRLLAVASVVVFALASLLLGLWPANVAMVYLSVAIWGAAVGGFATITQTALSRFAGASVDVAQSMYTTGWNAAVAIGGLVGGVLLNRTGAASFSWVVLGILALCLAGTVMFMNRALVQED